MLPADISEPSSIGQPSEHTPAREAEIFDHGQSETGLFPPKLTSATPLTPHHHQISYRLSKFFRQTEPLHMVRFDETGSWKFKV